jgi:hypothetical protein
MKRMSARGPGRGVLRESRPMARRADKHGERIRARMAVDSGELHLTEHDRSAYRPVDHSRTVSISCAFTSPEGLKQIICPETFKDVNG